MPNFIFVFQFDPCFSIQVHIRYIFLFLFQFQSNQNWVLQKKKRKKDQILSCNLVWKQNFCNKVTKFYSLYNAREEDVQNDYQVSKRLHVRTRVGTSRGLKEKLEQLPSSFFTISKQVVVDMLSNENDCNGKVTIVKYPNAYITSIQNRYVKSFSMVIC